MTDEQKNKIKKLLYKQNPDAVIFTITKTGILYTTQLKSEEFDDREIHVLFLIPFEDIGDAKFLNKMDSKLLIRWINTISI